MEKSYHPTQEQVRYFAENPFAFISRLGLKALEFRPGYVKLMMPLKGNESHFGGMYAGAVFTLAEMPPGVLYMTTFDITRFYPVVKEMNIRFKRPAMTDLTVEVSLSDDEIVRISTEAGEKGKSGFSVETKILDASLNVVAESTGIYQLRLAEKDGLAGWKEMVMEIMSKTPLS